MQTAAVAVYQGDLIVNHDGTERLGYWAKSIALDRPALTVAFFRKEPQHWADRLGATEPTPAEQYSFRLATNVPACMGQIWIAEEGVTAEMLAANSQWFRRVV